MIYRVGDIVEGIVTGIQPYGAFVSLSDQQQGMIHISEISDRYVQDVGRHFNIGDHVIAKIIDRDSGHLRLSLKAHKNQRRSYGKSSYNNASVADQLPVSFEGLKGKLPLWIKTANMRKEDKIDD